MPKPANAKKSDQKPSKKRLSTKQEKPLNDIKVKHAPPVSSKDIIAKAEANVRAAKPQKPKPALKPAVKKPISDSSSSEDSSDSESEPDPQPPKAATRETKTNGKSAPSKKISSTKPPTPTKNKKAQRASPSDSSSDSGSSSDDSSSEDGAPAKLAPLPKTNGTPKPAKSGNGEEGTSEDDSSEDEKPKAQQIKTVPKPLAGSPDEESSSSSEDSDSDSGSGSDTPPKPSVHTSKKAQPAKVSSSDSDSSSDEESSGSDSDEDVEMQDPTPAVVTTGKRKAEDSPAFPTKKTKIDESTAIAKHEDGSTKTIFVGNLSWTVDNDRLSQEFADCGEVVSARVQLDRNTGRSRGFGYVTFAATEAADAAIALNGTKEIDGRTLNLDKSTDVGPNREKRAQAFGDNRSAPSKVLFVGNLSWNTVEDTLWDAFSEYGEVSSVRLPTDRESGKPKGYGYIEFSIVDSAQKAIDAMNGKELDGRPIRLDFSQPRDANSVGRGRGASFGGGMGRGSFGGGRGRGGSRGRGGDRGRGRGGARGGMRTGAITTSEGKKITF